MPNDRIDLPQGTLDLLILKTLALGSQHGWAISERIQQISSKVLQVQQRSLYPALHGLERRGWIKAHWGVSDNNRRAKALASVGMYAVMAHSVSQRTQEIGVRLAMGATAANIVRLVFAQGMRQLALGLTVGLAAAYGLTRVLRALLAGTLQPDPKTFLTVALVLALAGALACVVPARRAVRVDPVVALRCE